MWIKTIEEDKAEGTLKHIYEMARGRYPVVANVLKSTSLKPALLQAFLGLYMEIMTKEGNLPRWVKEMIAVLVSSLNHCHY